MESVYVNITQDELTTVLGSLTNIENVYLEAASYAPDFSERKKELLDKVNSIKGLKNKFLNTWSKGYNEELSKNI